MAGSDLARERWRSRLLCAATPLQLVVAVASMFALVDEVRSHLADAEARAITRAWLVLLTPVATTIARTGLAVAALLALVLRRDRERTRRLLILCYTVTLPLLVVPHLLPLAWSYDVPPEVAEQQRELLRLAGPALAAAGLADIAPVLPSIAVGLSRAGLQRLRGDGGDVLGALVATVASLQLALVGTMALAVVEPIAGDGRAALGLLFVLLHYALASAVCLRHARPSRPLRRGSRRLLLGSTLLLLLPGAGLLLLGIDGVRIMDHGLVDWHGDGSGLWSPTALASHLAEFASRSLLTAAVAGDLLARADSSTTPS